MRGRAKERGKENSDKEKKEGEREMSVKGEREGKKGERKCD